MSLFLSEYERSCAGFDVILSVILQKDSKVHFVQLHLAESHANYRPSPSPREGER
jgi:hypothetical protein